MAEFVKTVIYTIDCPACGDSNIIKTGNRNGYQRYKCNACKKKFRADGQAKGRKFDDELIGATIFEYYQGISIRNSARSIGYRYGIPRPSTDTIYQWIKDYTEAATYAIRDVKAHTGDRWVADEMVIDVDGQNVYHWNVMDRDTRFLLASHVSKGRGEEDAIQVFKKALARADHPPQSITTDKWVAYPPALAELMPNTKHIRARGIRHWINNNLSERMQGRYRSRIKTLRGLWDLTSAQQFLDGYTLTYNHFTDHGALSGRTPAQAAKMKIPFKEWADVVRADIEVPEEWKREPRMRPPRVKEYAGHTKKGYRKRPRNRKEVLGVQLGMWRKKKPSKADRERVEALARARAPQPVMPKSSPKTRTPAYDTQLRMLSMQMRPIPKRVRPHLVGQKRR